MNKHINTQVFAIFFQVLSEAKNEMEMETLLRALLSDKELTSVAKRLAIAIFLDKGHSYDHISKTLGVSSATIASVAELINSKGVQLALRKVKAEEWAEVWSARISRTIEKLIKK